MKRPKNPRNSATDAARLTDRLRKVVTTPTDSISELIWLLGRVNSNTIPAAFCMASIANAAIIGVHALNEPMILVPL